jgi:ABC-type antimicrobial peptide transport system permease subunit
MDELQARIRPESLVGRVVEFLGYLALLLAAAGLYAVVSFLVSTRYREIAIRMTLGAHAQGILAMVLRQSLAPAIVGVIGGAFVTVVVSSWIQFWNNQPIDINRMAFVRAAIELMLAMLIASAIPALRAARVDPIANLKDH